MTQLAVTDQIRLASQKQNRIAAAVGGWLAFLAPLGSFALAHFAPLGYETRTAVYCSALLAFCLAFSAPKVFRWARETFSVVEAVGFVGLTEGLSLLPHDIHWLLTVVSFYGLAVLLVANSVTGAVKVSLSQRELRAAAREQTKPEATVVSLASRKPSPSGKTKRPVVAKKAGAR